MSTIVEEPQRNVPLSPEVTKNRGGRPRKIITPDTVVDESIPVSHILLDLKGEEPCPLVITFANVQIIRHIAPLFAVDPEAAFDDMERRFVDGAPAIVGIRHKLDGAVTLAGDNGHTPISINITNQEANHLLVNVKRNCEHLTDTINRRAWWDVKNIRPVGEPMPDAYQYVGGWDYAGEAVGLNV